MMKLHQDVDSPLITAVVPTFNRSKLLRRAIVSILDQQDVPLQVCVFDNASDDDTSAVVAALSAKDDRILYHRHPQNIGSMANFEFGLRRVRTP